MLAEAINFGARVYVNGEIVGHHEDPQTLVENLRRVISPLSRSQPHFEARDLHATQWGRICPSETPEGPNCGLVKNFAQGVELSKGADDSANVKKILVDLGVEAVGGNIG